MSISHLEIASLISDRFAREVAEVVDHKALFSRGLLDSFHLVELMSLLEERYSIRIKATEVNLENFDTVQSIAAFVARKTAG